MAGSETPQPNDMTSYYLVPDVRPKSVIIANNTLELVDELKALESVQRRQTLVLIKGSETNYNLKDPHTIMKLI